MPTWSPGDAEASAGPGTATGPSGQYRNKLGALQPFGRDPAPEISLQFSVGRLHVAVATATESTLDQLVRASGKRLKRAGFSCLPPFPVEVAGFADGRGRVVTRKKKGRRPAGEPEFQVIAMSRPYSLTLTVPEAQADLVGDFGPVTVDQAAPPAIVPIVRIPVPGTTVPGTTVPGTTVPPATMPGATVVGERLILTERRARLTAMITREPVTASSDQYAMACLQEVTSRTKDIAISEGQPDTFLGGQYCLRRTSVVGGVKAGSSVRSEYWWAGVVAGYGVQIIVAGTKSIIDLDQARGLKDAVVLIPAG